MHPRTVRRLRQTPIHPPAAFHKNALQQRPAHRAFTLIELIVVIAIIIILAGFLYPAYQAVQNQTRKTQAKNDLTQIVTAVNAFYTDYGRYPFPSSVPAGSDCSFSWTIPTTFRVQYNDEVLNELRACNTTTDPSSCSANASLNTRKIVFISPPTVKDPNNPRSGIATAAGNRGRFYDPWGAPYNLLIDSNYDDIVRNPYVALGGSGAGPDPVRQGVIGWSNGGDLQVGTNSNNIYTNSDDVISWQ